MIPNALAANTQFHFELSVAMTGMLKGKLEV
jgi:hypothetical protein